MRVRYEPLANRRVHILPFLRVMYADEHLSRVGSPPPYNWTKANSLPPPLNQRIPEKTLHIRAFASARPRKLIHEWHVVRHEFWTQLVQHINIAVPERADTQQRPVAFLPEVVALRICKAMDEVLHRIQSKATRTQRPHALVSPTRLACE